MFRINKYREEEKVLKEDIRNQIQTIKENHKIISEQNSELYGGVKNDIFRGMFGGRMPISRGPEWSYEVKTIAISKGDSGKGDKNMKKVEYKDLTDDQKKKFDESMGQAEQTFDKADELFSTIGDKNVTVAKEDL
jgi:hypothetical protein